MYFLYRDKDDKLKVFVKEIEMMDEMAFTLMVVMDTRDVIIDNKRKGKPCSEYMQTLEFYVTQGHVRGTLVFAVDPWDGLKKQREDIQVDTSLEGRFRDEKTETYLLMRVSNCSYKRLCE